jgi:hypothetical protein
MLHSAVVFCRHTGAVDGSATNRTSVCRNLGLSAVIAGRRSRLVL